MPTTKEKLMDAEFALTECMYSLMGGSTEGLDRDAADASKISQMLVELRLMIKERYAGK